jgi:hypothetical protein
MEQWTRCIPPPKQYSLTHWDEAQLFFESRATRGFQKIIGFYLSAQRYTEKKGVFVEA